jgi:hypothetical protein
MVEVDLAYRGAVLRILDPVELCVLDAQRFLYPDAQGRRGTLLAVPSDTDML